MSMIGWLFLMFLWLVLVSVFYHFPVQRMMNHGESTELQVCFPCTALVCYSASQPPWRGSWYRRSRRFRCDITFWMQHPMQIICDCCSRNRIGEKPGNPELLLKQFQSAQFSKRWWLHSACVWWDWFKVFKVVTTMSKWFHMFTSWQEHRWQTVLCFFCWDWCCKLRKNDKGERLQRCQSSSCLWIRAGNWDVGAWFLGLPPCKWTVWDGTSVEIESCASCCFDAVLSACRLPWGPQTCRWAERFCQQMWHFAMFLRGRPCFFGAPHARYLSLQASGQLHSSQQLLPKPREWLAESSVYEGIGSQLWHPNVPTQQ